MKKSVYLLFLVFFWACASTLEEDLDIEAPASNPCFIGPGGVGCPIDPIDPIDPDPDPDPISRFRYFHRGNSNAALYWSQSINEGISWTSGGVNNSAESNSGPAAVFHNNQFHVFYRGNSSDKVFRSNSYNGQSWNGNQWVRSDMRSTESVTAISFGGKIWLGYASPDHVGATYTTSTDGFTWTTPVELPTTTTGVVIGAPSFVEFEGSLYTLYTDHLGKLYYHKYNNATSSWETRVEIDNPNATLYYPNPWSIGYLAHRGLSATSFDGYIYVAYRHMGDDFVETWGFDPDATFNQFTIPARPNLMKTSERPTIASDGTNLLIIFKNGVNSQIWQAKSTNGYSFTTVQVPGQTNSVPSVFHYID